MVIKNPSTFPKTSTLTNDLFALGVRAPDTNPEDVLINFTSILSSGGSGGLGHIIVDDSNIVYPQQSRLKFINELFLISDNASQNQTEIAFNTSNLMFKSDYLAPNGTISNQYGGLGTDITGLNGVLLLQGGVAIANKYELIGSGPPTPTDDSTQGFVVGSRWISGNNEWVATSVAAGNATWLTTTAGAGTGNRHTLQAAGTSLTPRTNLNFVGSGLTNIYDDPVNDATIVQIEQGDMTKGQYDANNDGYINLAAGGTGANNSLTKGLFGADGAGMPISFNYLELRAINPTAGNDIADGISIGTLWHNSSANRLFINSDATAGSAKWIELGRQIGQVDGANLLYANRQNQKIFSSNGTIQITHTDNASLNRTEIDIVAPSLQPTISHVLKAADTSFSIRDSDHGKYFILSGSHDVRFPSSSIATIRDGFQCSFILATSGSEISFVQEDTNSIVNGTGNKLSTQWRAVHAFYVATLNVPFGVWFIVGGLA